MHVCLCFGSLCVYVCVCVFFVLFPSCSGRMAVQLHTRSVEAQGEGQEGGGQDGTEKVQTRQNRGDCPKKGKGSDDA